MARPTKYNEEIIERAKDYVAMGYEEEEPVPTIAGLSLWLNISRETVYAWSDEEDKVQFSDIVSRLMAKQEMKLSAGGIRGDFNANITKLMLTKHGYSDKRELTGADGKDLIPSGIDTTYE